MVKKETLRWKEILLNIVSYTMPSVGKSSKYCSKLIFRSFWNRCMYHILQQYVTHAKTNKTWDFCPHRGSSSGFVWKTAQPYCLLLSNISLVCYWFEIKAKYDTIYKNDGVHSVKLVILTPGHHHQFIASSTNVCQILFPISWNSGSSFRS